MSQRAGTVKNGELWLRCPECGDSQRNLQKGHLSVNLAKSVFYCVRCAYAGVLTPKQSFDLACRYDIDFPTEESPEAPHVEPTAGTTRFSALRRWHYSDDSWNTWDVFDIRDPRHNEDVGQYFRLGSTSLIFGESGLGYCGSSLISTANSPIRLVEGPYDVLSDRDVCCYGFLRSQALKLLRGHFVTLCPDGDVWQDDLLRQRFMKTVKWSLNTNQSPTIMGLEMIPDGKDPDECHESDRLLVKRDQLLQRLSMRQPINLRSYL